MADEYMVQSYFHGEGKVVASFVDVNGQVTIKIHFPNSKSLQQREQPIATIPLLKAIKSKFIVSNDPNISNEVLCVELTKIAESAVMPRYSEICPPPNTEHPYRSHCFNCRLSIDSRVHEKCNICAFYFCPNCGACLCNYK